MLFSQQLLLNFSSLALAFIIIGGSVIISALGLLLVRRLVPHHRLKLHNDVAGPIFSTLGVIYAVLMAFIVIVVWQNFCKSRLNVENEANALADLYKDAECFPDNFKQEARGLINKYADVVIHQEWPLLARGEESPVAAEITRKMWKLYSGFLPKNATEQVFFEESVRELNQLGELRTSRLLDSRVGVHPLLWLVLIFGGVITVVFTFVFGAESLKAQMTMAILLSILISLTLFTILLLDFPFSGSINIPPDAFRQILINKY